MLRGSRKRTRLDTNLHIRLTTEEKTRLLLRANAHGYYGISEYVRALAKYVRPPKGLKEANEVKKWQQNEKIRELAQTITNVLEYDGNMTFRDILIYTALQLGADEETVQGTLGEVACLAKIPTDDVVWAIALATGVEIGA